MYYAHFGLKEPPFKITPNTDFFFTGGNRGAVLDALVYAIANGEGIIKIVGEVGSGKTMLCRMLQTVLPETVETVYLANPSMAPEEVLQAIATELQLPLGKDADKLQVMQALQQHLISKHEAGRQVVIFVEEAQGMPLSTLEEIRLLTNLETKRDKLLQIVLFGQPELDGNLNAPQIRQLKERITQSFHLGPLSEADIAEYLIFRLRSAGYYGPHLFAKPAIALLSKTAKGLVRRVNILADKALLAAFSENVYLVTPKHVKAAIADSEFGDAPLPMHSSAPVVWRWAVAMVATLAIGIALGVGAPTWLSGKKEAKPITAAISPNTPAAEAAAPLQKIPATASVAPQEPDAKVQTVNFSQPADDILTDRLKATQIWLNENPDTTTSLQLMGGASDEQIRSQLSGLAAQLDKSNLYAFRTKVGLTPFVSVLYGSFATRAEADAARNQLPQALQANRPQIRTIGGIIKEIKHIQ